MKLFLFHLIWCLSWFTFTSCLHLMTFVINIFLPLFQFSFLFTRCFIFLLLLTILSCHDERRWDLWEIVINCSIFSVIARWNWCQWSSSIVDCMSEPGSRLRNYTSRNLTLNLFLLKISDFTETRIWTLWLFKLPTIGSFSVHIRLLWDKTFKPNPT